MDEFIRQLFLERVYTWEVVLLYIFIGVLAGMTRLIIKGEERANLKQWWTDGSLIGAIVISTVGALLFDNNFVWAFLGGYFIVHVLEYLHKKLGGKNES